MLSSDFIKALWCQFWLKNSSISKIRIRYEIFFKFSWCSGTISTWCSQCALLYFAHGFKQGTLFILLSMMSHHWWVTNKHILWRHHYFCMISFWDIFEFNQGHLCFEEMGDSIPPEVKTEEGFQIKNLVWRSHWSIISEIS